MLNEIGNIVVIGLDARRDRWKRCEQIFRQNAISPVTHYRTEADYNDLHRHYMKDFLQMLRVRGRGEYLVFFEDDFELVDGWEAVLREAWAELPPDFDMLYLGANLTRMPHYYSEHLMKVQGAWLMHAVIMSRQWIDYVLRHYDLNAIWIIDEWYRRIAPTRKFYMTYPMISYQRAGYSDATGKYEDYKIYENQYYENYCNDTRLSASPERRSGVDAA